VGTRFAATPTDAKNVTAKSVDKKKAQGSSGSSGNGC
jgi:hypothetical protein